MKVRDISITGNQVIKVCLGLDEDYNNIYGEYADYLESEVFHIQIFSNDIFIFINENTKGF